MGLPESWGDKPQRVPLRLTRGQDLLLTIYPPTSSAFPAGSKVKMVVYQDETPDSPILVTWEAATSPQAAEIVRQSEETDAIPDGSYTRVFYAAPDTPTADYCLAVGAVTRY